MLPGEFLPFLGEDTRTGILQRPWGTLGGTLPRVWPRGQLTTSSLCFPGCRGMKSEACRHDILDRRTDVNTGDCKPLHPPHWHHACSPPSTLVGPSCLALFNAELAHPADLLHFICLLGTPHVCSQGPLCVILDLPSLLLGSVLLVSQLCALGAKQRIHFRAQDAVGAQ